MSRSQPNILLLFPDHHRWDWLGLYGRLPLGTPVADALAARGALFTDAICPSPLCAPSRACLAAGREYDRCGVSGNDVDLPSESPTIYRMLRDAGYHVAGCGKFDLHKASFIWGRRGANCLDAWGFCDGIDSEGKYDGVHSYARAPRGAKGPYMAYLESLRLAETHVQDFAARKSDQTFPTPLSDEAYSDNWIAANADALLARTPRGKPWFLQVNFTGPHPPWDITAGMAALYEGVKFPAPAGGNADDGLNHQAVRRNFAAMITNIDRLCGQILSGIEARGELDNTLVVFSSDHGEMLGDLGLWGKSRWYHPSIAVPMILAGPGVRAGAVHRGPATTLDLAATFLEAAGVAAPADMDSRSLWPLLRGQSPGRPHVYCGLGDWRMVYDGRHKLVVHGDGRRVLYDRLHDPCERTDLSAQASPALTGLSALMGDRAP